MPPGVPRNMDAMSEWEIGLFLAYNQIREHEETQFQMNLAGVKMANQF